MSFLTLVTSMNTCLAVSTISDSVLKKTFASVEKSKKNPRGVRVLLCTEHLAPGPGSKGDGCSVDDVRELTDLVRSWIPPERVLVVVAYPSYSESAQNALLKIIEETPAHLTICLVYTAQTRLLGTITSRLYDASASSPVFARTSFSEYRQMLNPEQVIRLQKILGKAEKLPSAWVSDLKKALRLPK